jgi:glycerol kinase
MQFQSDLLGVPIVRPEISETTALGAAFLAGLAVRIWRKKSDVADQWREARRFVPQMPDARRDALRAGWKGAIGRATSNPAVPEVT